MRLFDGIHIALFFYLQTLTTSFKRSPKHDLRVNIFGKVKPMISEILSQTRVRNDYELIFSILKSQFSIKN